MFTDPKIEDFAGHLFNALWKHHGLIESSEPQQQTSPEFDDNIFRSVQLRLSMFQSPYEAMFENIYLELVGNFFDSIVDFFPHYLSEDDPEEESVMSAFLSSCAFVADVSMRGHARGHDDFLEVGRRAWAEFAELTLGEAFYEAGGWPELRSFASREAVVYDYVTRFPDRVFLTWGAVESFDAFEDWERRTSSVDDDRPYALKWVDFSVRVPFVGIKSPDHFSQPIPVVFDEIAAAIWIMSTICHPWKYGELLDDDYSDACSPTAYLKRIVTELGGESDFASIREETSSVRESFDERDRDKIGSDVAINEQVVIVKMLPSCEGREDSKVIKTENEESFLHNKNTSHQVGEPKVENYRGLKEALLGLLPLDTPRTPNDTSYFFLANDSDDSQPKVITNPDDLDTLADYLGLKKFSDTASADSVSRAKVFVITTDPDNTPIHADSPEKTPKQDLLSPLKSPRTPLRRMNSTGSDGMKRKKSTGKENSPSHKRKTDSKKNAKIPHQKRITVKDSPNLEAGGQTFWRNQNEYTEKDSISLNHLSCETSINIDQSLPIRNFISSPRNLFPIIDEADYPSKDDKDPSLPGKKIGEDERVRLAKYGVKTCERSHRLELKSEMHDQIRFSGNSFLDSEMTSKPTTEQSKLPKIGDMNSLLRRIDSIGEKLFSTQLAHNSSCLTVPHQNSTLTNDNKNYRTPEKPLKILEPAGKNRPSRLSEKECERPNRQISQGSSSAKIYKLTEENFSSEPTMENQFKVASGKLSNETANLNQCIQTSSSLKVPHQNPILANDDESYHVLEKPLKIFGPPREEGCGRSSRQDSCRTEIYEITEKENFSADSILGNQLKLVPGAGAESKNSFKTKLNYKTLLGKTENKIPSAKPTNENPLGFDKKAKENKSKKELNSNDSNREAMQTTQSESAAGEPALENAVGFSSEPQDAEKKGKKKKPKKRLSRLEQRVKEEGEGVRDVTRLIFVMGNQLGMASVASAFHDSKKQISKDPNK